MHVISVCHLGSIIEHTPIQGDQRWAVQNRPHRSRRVRQQALPELLEKLPVVERKRLLPVPPLRVYALLLRGQQTRRREDAGCVEHHERYDLLNDDHHEEEGNQPVRCAVSSPVKTREKDP